MPCKAVAFRVYEISINKINWILMHANCNTKGADQPVHPHSLLSTFVIGTLDTVIAKPAANRISIFQLFLVAWQIGSSHTQSKSGKTGLVVHGLDILLTRYV